MFIQGVKDWWEKTYENLLSIKIESIDIYPVELSDDINAKVYSPIFMFFDNNEFIITKEMMIADIFNKLQSIDDIYYVNDFVNKHPNLAYIVKVNYESPFDDVSILSYSMKYTAFKDRTPIQTLITPALTKILDLKEVTSDV